MSHVRFASNCPRPPKPGPQRSSRRRGWATILSFSTLALRARRNSGSRGAGRRWPTGCSMTGRLRCVLTGGKLRMEQEHIARIKAHLQHPVIDLSGKLDLLSLGALLQRARLLVTIDSAPMHLAAAFGTPQVALFGPTNPFHWRPRATPATILQAGNPAPVTDFVPKQPPQFDEGNLDGTGDRCYADAAVGSDSASHMSKIPPVAKVKEPLWTTIRRGWGPYKRLYSYALPYKWRFIVGLGFGFLYGLINSLHAAGHGERSWRRLPRPRRQWHRRQMVSASRADEPAARRSIRSSCSASRFRRS